MVGKYHKALNAQREHSPYPCLGVNNL